MWALEEDIGTRIWNYEYETEYENTVCFYCNTFAGSSDPLISCFFISSPLLSSPLLSSPLLLARLAPTIAIRAPPREAVRVQKHNGNEG